MEPVEILERRLRAEKRGLQLLAVMRRMVPHAARPPVTLVPAAPPPASEHGLPGLVHLQPVILLLSTPPLH